MGVGVHTALINLHPVFGSVEDGFELCRMYKGHQARLETILFLTFSSLKVAFANNFLIYYFYFYFLLFFLLL